MAMTKEQKQNILDHIEGAYNATVQKVENVSDYTERSYKQTVLANQANILSVLGTLIIELVPEEEENNG